MACMAKQIKLNMWKFHSQGDRPYPFQGAIVVVQGQVLRQLSSIFC